MGDANDFLVEVSFAVANPGDAEVLVDLIRKYYAYDGIAFDEGEMRSALAVFLNDATLGRVWLIRQAGKVIGYVIIGFGCDLEFGGRLGTITDLFLEPGFRRKGIGRKTLEFVEVQCAALGLRGLELQVERDNTEARALYEAFGFRAADRVPMSKRIGKRVE